MCVSVCVFSVKFRAPSTAKGLARRRRGSRHSRKVEVGKMPGKRANALQFAQHSFSDAFGCTLITFQVWPLASARVRKLIIEFLIRISNIVIVIRIIIVIAAYLSNVKKKQWRLEGEEGRGKGLSLSLSLSSPKSLVCALKHKTLFSNLALTLAKDPTTTRV